MAEPLYGATTMWDLVEQRTAASPDAPMLLDADDRRVTFGEFRDRVERAAAGFHALGVTEGTPVTWQLTTRIETVVASIALARLGAVQNPIIHIYREREVGYALRQTNARFFLVPGTWRGFDYMAMADALAKDLDDPPQVIACYDDLPEGDPAALPSPPARGDIVRWIYSTSGTTSEPKGVQHTDQTLLAGGRGLAVALDMSPADVGCMAFPFGHIAGPDYLVTMLAQGFPAVLIEAWDPVDAIALLQHHGATMAGGSTAHYLAFLAEQRKDPDTKVIETLRLLSGGGAPKPPEIFYEVQREIGVPVAHGYGMTESPMISQGSPHDTDEQLANTDGKPVFGIEVKIADLDGKSLPAGADGEVCLRGPMLFKGYTDVQLTAEAHDADGYFKTGDVGHLRDDGHLVLTGRIKDIIIRKGENISAREIEDLLYQHPKVQDVAVIGLADRERGELVCAVVERVPGGDDLTMAEMQAYLRENKLMTQKIPEQLELLDALPRNETLRKILKYKLREQFGNA